MLFGVGLRLANTRVLYGTLTVKRETLAVS